MHTLLLPNAYAMLQLIDRLHEYCQKIIESKMPLILGVSQCMELTDMRDFPPKDKFIPISISCAQLTN